MNKLQQWLLFMFIFIYANTLHAQIKLDIEVHGVNIDIEKNIRLYLSVEQQKGHALLSEERLRILHKKAHQEIILALQPFGYYRPEIKSELIQSTTQQWKTIYTVNPGPPLPIVEINITLSGEIDNDIEFKRLIENHSLQKGDVFDHTKYVVLKNNLAKLAADRGYFDARFLEHRVEVNIKAYAARINLHYDGGKRYRFGEITLNQEMLNPKLLERYIPFKVGTPYIYGDLLDLQQALNDSDYFHSVEVSPGKADSIKNEIPIIVKLTPRRNHRYSIGIGYGSDTGARTKFGWEMPRVNENGHRVNTEAKISEIGYSVGAQYRVPVLNPRTDQMIYSTGVVNEKTATSDSTITKIGITLNRNLGLWRQSLALNYQQEKYIVASDQGISKLLIPSINYSRTWGQNIIYTLDGLRFDIGLRGASNYILSDDNFMQIQGGLKAITPLGKSDRIISRGRLGTTWTDNFHKLPSSVRFFAGGSQSVRGYSYQTLGPIDADGKVVGGKHLMIGSVEYEHSLSNKWGAALFYDVGNAYDNLEDKLEHGTGFGFRWKSPIGSVRFDFASAISVSGNPWRLHINIGPDL